MVEMKAHGPVELCRRTPVGYPEINERRAHAGVKPLFWNRYQDDLYG